MIILKSNSSFKYDKAVLSPHLHADGKRQFCSPLNIYGASQQNSIAASWRLVGKQESKANTVAPYSLSFVIQNPTFIRKDISYTLTWRQAHATSEWVHTMRST